MTEIPRLTRRQAQGRGADRRSAQRGVELRARGDAELGERPVQMRGDRAMAQVQPRTNLAVRQPFGGHPGDLELLGRQLVEGDRALVPTCLAARTELMTRLIGQ